jgi:hypothetical protein
VRRIIWIVVAIVIAGASIGGYLWMNREVERPAHPLEAIAADARLICEFHSLSGAVMPLSETEYGDALLANRAIGGPWQRTALLDSLFRPSGMLSTVTGFHWVPSDSSGLVTVMQAVGEVSSEDLRVELSALKGMGPIASESATFFHHDATDLYFAVTNSLVIAGGNAASVKNSISVLTSGMSAFQDSLLEKVRSSAGKNVQMNIYARMPSALFGPGSLWNEVGQMLSLDVTTKKEGLVMNGFAQLPDASSHLLALFRDQAPQPMQFQGGIPTDATSLLMFGASEMSVLHAGLLEHSGRKAELAALDARLGLEVSAHFLPWMAGQFGVCRLPLRGKGTQEFVVMMVSSVELADQQLHSLASAAGSDSAEVRALPLRHVLNLLLGDAMPRYEEVYFTRHNDFVVFGPAAEAVSMYVHQLRADRTLASDVAFASFSEQFSSSYNVFSYQFLPAETGHMEGRASAAGRMVLDGLKDMFTDFPVFGVQFSNAGGSLYANMHWRYAPDWTKGPLNEAVASMDAPLNGRPWFVRNHLSGEPEVLAQDGNNMLYLFNRNGQELFRKQLSEAVVGDVVQIDRFKNGNLQYVLGTRNSIHQLDRNGKDVEGFPLELESPMNAALTVVEYDGKRDYRFLVSCQNDRVYNFGADGKKVKGWKLEKLSKPAVSPFAHLSVDRKDYLVLCESSGKIHLLDRTGAARAAVKESVKLSRNMRFQPFESKKKADTGFYATDEDGTVVHLQLTGKVRLLDFGKFTSEHRFLAIDLEGDGEPEFAFVDLNVLKVFDKGKKLVFERRLSPGAIGPFALSAGKADRFIGVALPEEGQVTAFGTEGDTVAGFPVAGDTQFDFVALPDDERIVVSGTARGLIIRMLE